MAGRTKSSGSRSDLIHQTLARRIGTSILSGDIAPGDPIGGEIEQSEAMGVSRNAYREAIRILISKGLIDSRPKIGTHVTPRARWNFLDPEMLAWMLSAEPDEKFIRDLFELRGLVEPAAAAFAASRRSIAQLAAMGEALEGMRRHTLATEQGRMADQRFHRIIFEACGNEPLASLASSVGAAVTWTTQIKFSQSAVPRDVIGDHERIYDAIASSSPGRAKKAMEELLRLALLDMHLD